MEQKHRDQKWGNGESRRKKRSMVAKTVATTTMKKRHFNVEATTKLKITLLYLKFGNVSFGACTATRIVFATRRTPKPNPKNFTWILSNSRNKYT